MILNSESRAAWVRFLDHVENLGHAERTVQGTTLDQHVTACWFSAKDSVARILRDIGPSRPRRILDIGSSTGLKCFALQECFPEAEVIGIEPEHEALAVARSMARAWPGRAPVFVEGMGESLPVPDASVDLIICHTVIEHVNDVAKVISEMARVLSAQGVIHLEAPNYNWPYEPHIGVWCIPRLGKRFVRLCGYLQGKSGKLSFLDHLQFVHPKWIELLFRQNGLIWENRAYAKLRTVVTGDLSQVVAHRRFAKIVRWIGQLGVGSVVVGLLARFGMYPSMLYTVRREAGVG